MAQLLARVFSGIQPSGIPHLGNYFGAISQWIELAKSRSDPTLLSIVDVHAYTSPRVCFGRPFYDNILSTTASLLALGLKPEEFIVFRQSDILEHNYLDNVFQNFISTQRLARMTQYKDKTSGVGAVKSVPTGLLTYPVLQAADILLYKANLVPVGEDQSQHIELTRDIAKRFNTAVACDIFPEPRAILNKSTHARRVRSLRDPSKKMSKSDPDKRSFIELVDEPDVLREKLKKAITDSTSAVHYDSDQRPGVSNLMRIHHLTTGENFDQIQERFAHVKTDRYKLELADILIERFRPVREEYKRIRGDHMYLEEVLEKGRQKAQPIARETVLQVKRLLGSINPLNMARAFDREL